MRIPLLIIIIFFTILLPLIKYDIFIIKLEFISFLLWGIPPEVFNKYLAFLRFVNPRLLLMKFFLIWYNYWKYIATYHRSHTPHHNIQSSPRYFEILLPLSPPPQVDYDGRFEFCSLGHRMVWNNIHFQALTDFRDWNYRKMYVLLTSQKKVQ